jgi:hypothetical protein
LSLPQLRFAVFGINTSAGSVQRFSPKSIKNEKSQPFGWLSLLLLPDVRASIGTGLLGSPQLRFATFGVNTSAGSVQRFSPK